MSVLAFGEILWDIINGVEHLGGAPFNFAAHSARCGNRTAIISRIGNDERGKKVIGICQEYGVSSKYIQVDNDRATGTVLVSLTDGQPDYTIHEDVAYDYIAAPPLDDLAKENFDLFYFGSLAQRCPVSASTLFSLLKHSNFRHVFYDVNLRKKGYNVEILHRSLKVCTVLKLNVDEVPVVGKLISFDDAGNESFCQQIVGRYRNVESIVITAADKGSYVFVNNSLQHIPGKKVIVKDAVGAGDAFSAAFMHSLIKTGDPIAAASVANALGAYVASMPGPIPDYPGELSALLAIGR